MIVIIVIIVVIMSTKSFKRLNRQNSEKNLPALIKNNIFAYNLYTVHISNLKTLYLHNCTIYLHSV